MSENNQTEQQPVQPEANPVPADVIELQQVLGDLASYRSLLRSSQIPGAMAQIGAKMTEFLNASYAQVLKQFNEHPYVVNARAEEKAKQDELLAQATAQS